MAEGGPAVPLHQEVRQPRPNVARHGCGEQESGPPAQVPECRDHEERRQSGARKVQEPGAGAAVLAQIVGKKPARTSGMAVPLRVVGKLVQRDLTDIGRLRRARTGEMTTRSVRVGSVRASYIAAGLGLTGTDWRLAFTA